MARAFSSAVHMMNMLGRLSPLWLSLVLSQIGCGGDHVALTGAPPSQAPPEQREEKPPGGETDAGPGAAACETGATAAASTLVASAPMGLGEHTLGYPVDKDFNFFVGPPGATLFEGAEVFETQLDVMEHEYVTIENSRQLAANFSGWGVSASFEAASSRRYAAYRAQQVAKVREIDDTAGMRTPPDQAVWYVSRIYYGHSFETVVSGESNEFHVGVRAQFMVASGSIQVFADSNKLTMTASGRGLEPRNGDAIFAQSAEEIEAGYSTSGDPVPILVEYKRIPETCLPAADQYPWLEPIAVTINYKSVEVYHDGSAGEDTWSLEASCKVNGKDALIDNFMIWTAKKNIGDGCESGTGPKDGTSFCSYDLFWSTKLELVESDELRCGIKGIAHDNNDSVDYSEFVYVAEPAGTPPVEGRFGNGNGQTEYWLNYLLEFGSVPQAQN